MNHNFHQDRSFLIFTKCQCFDRWAPLFWPRRQHTCASLTSARRRPQQQASEATRILSASLNGFFTQPPSRLLLCHEFSSTFPPPPFHLFSKPSLRRATYLRSQAWRSAAPSQSLHPHTFLVSPHCNTSHLHRTCPLLTTSIAPASAPPLHFPSLIPTIRNYLPAPPSS